ncbi:PepSY-like domain-containing protein [uncultured Helicobacter sp.]|uniref:PepSY-like domain-containing protein n=1 Tax=uncultured Helicobacter sp. TaxID=175537 RepID=UPI002612AEE5|nr:PepSY-like domain-containing protein [uncultured Helicobacter sp.]
MKSKLFLSLLFSSSALLANPTTPIEETIPLQNQTQQTAPTVNQIPPTQGNMTPTQPMNTYPNNAMGGYSASLQNIFTKVQQIYPGSFITDVDYKGFGYEIEINDSLELLFDMNGNLLWQKWD